MLESLLPIRNFYWADARYQPPLDLDGGAGVAPVLANLRGQFSLACCTPGGTLILARDPLGVNKLFFAIPESGTVVVANYLIDLVNRNVPFEAVYSVPAGHFLAIDLDGRTLSLRRYFDVDTAGGRRQVSVERAAQEIRQHLEIWFSRLAEQFRHRQVCVTLSGGLDSSLIAALAARYFPDVTAYTYGYAGSDRRESEDVSYARQVADFLGLRLRFVRATSDDVLGVLADALCYGQDWRDFNAHCAIVNEILARAIACDARRITLDEAPPGVPDAAPDAPLVLTGDLANELLADYAPLSCGGQEIYKLPRIGPEHLRTALLRGVDAGDREVGIFNHHGIDVIQPYGLVLDQYLQVPLSFIGGEICKQALVREIAGDLLPSFLFGRQKARAQIGDPVGPGGILSTLMRTGCDARWLRAAFARRFMVKEAKSLNGFIRLGRYRFLSEFPNERYESNGSDDGCHRAGARTLHPPPVPNTGR